MTPSRRLTTIIALLLGGGVATARAQSANGNLPVIPVAHGPLRLIVAYPAPGTAVDARDSIFLFGTVGNGAASLTVNGEPIAVAPNGAWIAWIGISHDSAFVLRLRARLGTDSLTQSLPLVHAGWTREVGAWVDRTSFTPVGDVRVDAAGTITLTVRAAAGASLHLHLPGHAPVEFVADSVAAPVPEGIRAFDHDVRNLVHPARGEEYVATVPASIGVAARNLFDPVAGGPSPILDVVLHGDTTRVPWPVAIHPVTTLPVAVRLDHDSHRSVASDPTIVGRTMPGGTYTWFFPPGTRTRADMRVGNEVRVRLANDAIAWLPSEAVHPVGIADPGRVAIMGSLTLGADTGRSTLRIPLTWPVPVSVDEDARALVITLYGAVSDANWTRYGAAQRFVQRVTWQQPEEDRVVLTVDFDRPLWGWRVHVDGTDLVFEFRQPPAIDHSRPLAGRRIVVDAGHPPGGACGPTGLCEPEANLAIADLVRDQLVAAGAHVTMTRTDSTPVALEARVALADSLGTDALVAIHNNAFPDGVNPLTNNGSATFFNHLPSLALARDVQQHLVANLGVRDLGVARGDLALVRPTWYPSILVEGLYLMIPAQEAALRTTAGQRLYASAVVAGLADFFGQVVAAPPR